MKTRIENTEAEFCSELYPRRCDITGKGMAQGWCIGEGCLYIAQESDCIAYCSENYNQTIEQAYACGDCRYCEEGFLESCEGGDRLYWTEWAQDDAEYIGEAWNAEGVLYTLSECGKFWDISKEAQQ